MPMPKNSPKPWQSNSQHKLEPRKHRGPPVASRIAQRGRVTMVGLAGHWIIAHQLVVAAYPRRTAGLNPPEQMRQGRHEHPHKRANNGRHQAVSFQQWNGACRDVQLSLCAAGPVGCSGAHLGPVFFGSRKERAEDRFHRIILRCRARLKPFQAPNLMGHQARHCQ